MEAIFLFGILPLIAIGGAAAFILYRLIDYPLLNPSKKKSQPVDMSEREMSEADQKSAKKLTAAFLGVFMFIMAQNNFQALDYVFRTKLNMYHSNWPFWLTLPLAFLEMCLLLIIGRLSWSILERSRRNTQ